MTAVCMQRRRPLRKLALLTLLALFPLAGPAPAQTVVAAVHEPFGLSVDPGGNLWVEQYNDATIDVISPTTNKVVKTIPVAPQPTQPAFFGGLAFFSSEYGNAVYAIDASAYKIRYSIAIPSPAIANVAIGPNGLGYAAADPDTVIVFRPADGAILGEIVTGANPRGIAFAADGAIMAVASRGTNALDLIDVAAMKVVRIAPVGVSPRTVAIVGAQAFTANYADGTVSAVDIATGELRATIAVGAHPRRLAASGARLFVSNEGSDSISIIDTHANEVAGTIAVGSSPRNIAVDAAGARLFVADYEANKAASINF
jgi:YVTN family beta-propeller protein